MSTIQPVYNHFATRPTTASLKSSFITPHALIRDQFPISTWLVLGALIQGLAHTFLPYRNIVLVLPVILYLSYQAGSTALILAGILPNPRMANVIPHRTALVYPNTKGEQDKPGNQTVCAILLGVVSHSPLGMLTPGYKEVGDRFEGMIRELSADASKHGFLGASAWLNATDRTTSSEYASIVYFENEDYLHAYAHGPMHSAAMQWWREAEKDLKHVGIMHEVFACPKDGWEGVYLNYHPTGLGATSKEVTGLDGRREWVNPLVKAKGKLVYSKGRMGRAYGEKEWEAFGATLSSEEAV